MADITERIVDWRHFTTSDNGLRMRSKQASAN
jgi:hypothetical protein